MRDRELSGGRSHGRRKPHYCHTLKSVYKTAALIAISGRYPVRDYYERLLAEGVAEHNARRAVAHYLAVITCGILKTGTPYEPYRWRRERSKMLLHARSSSELAGRRECSRWDFVAGEADKLFFRWRTTNCDVLYPAFNFPPRLFQGETVVSVASPEPWESSFALFASLKECLVCFVLTI
jgi:hypothetical protein